MRINFIYSLLLCVLILPLTVKSEEKPKKITIQFSQDLLATFTPKPHPVYVPNSYQPKPSQQSYKSGVNLCMFAQTIDRISLLLAGALVIYRLYILRKQLNSIEAPKIWHLPFAWWKKLSSYSHCLFDVGKTVLQVILLRLCTKQVIKVVCPKELRRSHSFDAAC